MPKITGNWPSLYCDGIKLNIGKGTMSYNMRRLKPTIQKALSNMKLLGLAAGLCIIAQWIDYPASKQCGSVGIVLFSYCLFRSICGRLDRS